ncbi:MAG: acyl-CoA synthetase, partial [Treponema sp.]|nr:acyl-CoA synthetase [Treponema sp.]
MAAVYPVLVFTFLVIFKLPVRVLSLCIIALAAAFFLSATGSRKAKGEKGVLDWKPLLSSALLLVAGLFCFFTQNEIFLKLYSVVVSATFLVIFGSTLFLEPTIIFRFATLADKSIIGSSYENQVKNYSRKVTIIWCCFFILNGTISVLTAFSEKIFSISPDTANTIWSVYNGGISYFLMGLLFICEYIVRKIVDGKMVKAISITKFKADSRKDNHIMCFEDVWSKKAYKTWLDFLTDTAKMRKIISETNSDEWIIHCEDYWYFLVTFVALLQCEKSVSLTQNISESF